MICSTEGCGRNTVARGLCGKHWQSWRSGPDYTPAPRLTPEERFRAKVYRDPLSGCWLWLAHINHNGYGHFGGPKGPVRAHRWAYSHFVGPIPEGLVLDHMCRVRHCVNPQHLRPVTWRENVLMGDTLAARAKAKTHCIRGHTFDETNTGRNKNGTRYCRACARLRYAA